MRLSCWRMTAALNPRWAGRLACCQSQPPQPPGRAYGHGAVTRSGEGRRTSTASALANLAVAWVTVTLTRSPGSAWRTNITQPVSSCLETHQPPWTTSPTVSSSTSPACGAEAASVVTAPSCPADARAHEAGYVAGWREARAYRDHGMRAG